MSDSVRSLFRRPFVHDRRGLRVLSRGSVSLKRMTGAMGLRVGVRPKGPPCAQRRGCGQRSLVTALQTPEASPPATPRVRSGGSRPRRRRLRHEASCGAGSYGAEAAGREPGQSRSRSSPLGAVPRAPTAARRHAQGCSCVKRPDHTWHQTRNVRASQPGRTLGGNAASGLCGASLPWSPRSRQRPPRLSSWSRPSSERVAATRRSWR